MDTKLEGQQSSNKLFKGETVYLLGRESVIDNGELSVTKATVFETKSANGQILPHPYVKPWLYPNEEPGRDVAIVEKSIQELFTEDEVLEAIAGNEHLAGVDTSEIDEIIMDPDRQKELVIALGAATMMRLPENTGQPTQP
jgi:hypothetical protein